MNEKCQWRLQGEKDKKPLHYPDCGLDDVYLLSGYEVVSSSHGEGITVKNLDELHMAIGSYLAHSKKVLAKKELRFLRKQMDLSQSDLGKLMGLSSQQVARWEKGESDISGSADALLRGLYVEHAGGNLNLQALLKHLDELDATSITRNVFQNTDDGWKIAA